ncbi:MAG: family 10 glycosylhydrolase [Gemmatimonadetes bacterium]|nr:family 10 glycosylhydrolase [Gemmatimonadota bacterium]
MRRLVAVIALALCATAAHAQPSATPPDVPREFRGVWVASVTNIDWPSKPGLSSFEQQAELIAILDRTRALNMNAVILQVRPAADALYASPLEPWSAYLTGVEGRAPEPFYDPLAFAVREAHARGLELHAWFNPYRARHATATYVHAATHVSEASPTMVRRYGKSLWMDPGDPAVVRRTLAVMLDVVKRYDVDGIHIDDYFYPYPENGADGQPMEFPDAATFAAYRKRGGTLAKDDWRRHNVDTLVAQIYRQTKRAKPWVQVGISPFGIWRPGFPAQIKGFDAYAKLYADAKRWLHEGWLDYLTPQLYWPIAQEPQAYPVLLKWWMDENTRQRHLWPGHYTTRGVQGGGLWGPDEIANQVKASRAARAGGDVHFSMKPLMPAPPAIAAPTVSASAAASPSAAAPTPTAGAAPDASGAASSPAAAPSAAAPLLPIGERLLRDVYQQPALAPATPWLETRAMPAPVVALVRDTASREQVVTLVPARGRDVAHWTVRIRGRDAWRTLILPGAQRSLVVAAAGDSVERVVVTAVDRVGVESALIAARVGATATTPRPAPARKPKPKKQR